MHRSASYDSVYYEGQFLRACSSDPLTKAISSRSFHRYGFLLNMSVWAHLSGLTKACLCKRALAPTPALRRSQADDVEKALTATSLSAAVAAWEDALKQVAEALSTGPAAQAGHASVMERTGRAAEAVKDYAAACMAALALSSLHSVLAPSYALVTPVLDATLFPLPRQAVLPGSMVSAGGVCRYKYLPP